MIGRRAEQELLKNILKSKEPEFVALIGRRRVGKTYLIRETYKGRITFEITGIQNATQSEQLLNFRFALNQYFQVDIPAINTITSWISAFELLISLLEAKRNKKKKVLFFDELPWLATARSGFLKGLSFFWNSWASKRNVVLVICGSAASWMIQKVVLHRGGLHNRITAQINLLPFSIEESLEYLVSRGVRLSAYQMAQLYMTIGGIPYYLKQVPKAKSIPQIISHLMFGPRAVLGNEFDNLYQSLFSNYDKYIAIVEACYSKWKGLTHTELVKKTGLSSGGSLSRMVRDLELSGFLMLSQPYSKKRKDTLIRLVDEFSIFHLKFKKGLRLNNWQAVSSSQSYKSWLGFAFENFCLKHIEAIKKTLGISGVTTFQYSYVQRATDYEEGAQIDLIIDRTDEVTNLCEVKFHQRPFVINKAYAAELMRKVDVLNGQLPDHKVVHLTLISSFGLKTNKYSSLIKSEVKLLDFFENREK